MNFEVLKQKKVFKKKSCLETSLRVSQNINFETILLFVQYFVFIVYE